MAKTGAVLFISGALATLITIGLWLINGTALPLSAYLASMLMPLGLLVLGLDFVRKARRSVR